MKSTEIIRKYTAGEATLEETNAALMDVRAGFHLDPQRNVIQPDEVGRFGLLDTGTGTLDKVEVRDGRLEYAVNEVLPDGSTNMRAEVCFAGKYYTVYGDLLVAQE